MSTSRVSRSDLEEEVKKLRKTTERDKELLGTLQSQIIQGRLRYLDMEEKWEKERRVRMKMEHALLAAGYEVSIVDETEEDQENQDSDVESTRSSRQSHDHAYSQSMSPTYTAYDGPPGGALERSWSPPTPITDPGVDEMPPPKGNDISPSHNKRSTPSTRASAPAQSSTSGEGASSTTSLKRKRPSTKAQPAPILPSKSSYKSRTTSRSQLNTLEHPILPPPLPVSVSRRALSKAFGAPMVSPRWHSKDHSHRFLFSKPKSHPHAPSTPGKSGMIHDLGVDSYRGGPWSVLYECGDEKKGMWGYAGEYLASDGGEINEIDWDVLAKATKKSYVDIILRAKEPGAALDIRSRISFRKVNGGRTPSTKELKQHTATLFANGFDDSLLAEEIDDAFAIGEEHLRIIQLDFISYDHDRARGLIHAQEHLLAAPDPQEGVIKTEPTESEVPKKRVAKGNRKLALSSSSTQTSTGGMAPKVFVEIQAPKKRPKVDRVST